jgi:hypothetical protein
MPSFTYLSPLQWVECFFTIFAEVNSKRSESFHATAIAYLMELLFA